MGDSLLDLLFGHDSAISSFKWIIIFKTRSLAGFDEFIDSELEQNVEQSDKKCLETKSRVRSLSKADHCLLIASWLYIVFANRPNEICAAQEIPRKYGKRK